MTNELSIATEGSQDRGIPDAGCRPFMAECRGESAHPGEVCLCTLRRIRAQDHSFMHQRFCSLRRSGVHSSKDFRGKSSEESSRALRYGPHDLMECQPKLLREPICRQSIAHTYTGIVCHLKTRYREPVISQVLVQTGSAKRKEGGSCFTA